MNVVIIVPSFKVSGGIREVLKLSSELSEHGCANILLSLWNSPHAMNTQHVEVEHLSTWPPRLRHAIIEFPVLFYRFARWRRKKYRYSKVFVFTHYSTLPLALLVPRHQRFFFVQDLEWNFVSNRLMSQFLRIIVLGIYRSGRIISANAYLSERLTNEDVSVALEAPIWANENFVAPDALERDIDFVMVLRKGDHKRLDLYLRFIALASTKKMRVAVITPESSIADQIRDQVSKVLLRPDHSQMRDLYTRSSCFIHLSEHEGFGLPPLEAMGAGCVPVCRDSGGVRAYMRNGPCADLLLPLSMPLEDVFASAVAAALDPSITARRAAVRNHFKLGQTHSNQARDAFVHTFMKEEEL